MMDLRQIVEGIHQGLGWEIEEASAHNFTLRIPIPEGRHQRVTVSPGSDPDTQPLLFVWSEVGDAADLGDPWKLLELNAGLEYGALALHEGAVFLRESVRLDSLDPGSAARILFHVAVAADELERYAYGEDDDTM